MTVSTHTLTLPGAMIERGFWLYVWRIKSPVGKLLYVGRTGDNSSPNAAALERELAAALKRVEYDVLNQVHSKQQAVPSLWVQVHEAFATHFPKLVSDRVSL